MAPSLSNALVGATITPAVSPDFCSCTSAKHSLRPLKLSPTTVCAFFLHLHTDGLMLIMGLHNYASVGKLCSHKISHSHPGPLHLLCGPEYCPVLVTGWHYRAHLIYPLPDTNLHCCALAGRTVIHSKACQQPGSLQLLVHLYLSSAIVFGTGPHHYIWVYNQPLPLNKHLQVVPASEYSPLALATTTACPSIYSLRTPVALKITVGPHSTS